MRRIVLVGTNDSVRTHAERYARFEDATVVGVVPDAGTLPDGIDAPRYDSLATALDTAGAHGVDICGSGVGRTDAIGAALSADVPVRCDPPLSLDDAATDRLVSRASDGTGWVLVRSPHRFSRLYERLRTTVETGRIGTLGVARIKRTAPFDGPGWNVSYADAQRQDHAEDALCTVLAHDFDILEWTFDAIERVFVRVNSGDRFDHAHALLTLRDGSRATVETTWGRDDAPAPRLHVEYSGDHGRLDFHERDASTALSDGTRCLTVDPVEDDCRGRSLRTFVASIRGEERPPEVISDVGATRVATAVLESANSGKPVTLGEEPV